MLKAHLVAQHKAVRGIKLQLIVVTEPMKTGAARDHAGRREVGFRFTLTARIQGAEREGGEAAAEEVTSIGWGGHA